MDVPSEGKSFLNFYKGKTGELVLLRSSPNLRHDMQETGYLKVFTLVKFDYSFYHFACSVTLIITNKNVSVHFGSFKLHSKLRGLVVE